MTTLVQSLPREAVKTDKWVATGLAAFALLCIFFFLWPVWRAFLPLEIDLKEAWVAYQVSALRAHQLYPSADGLISNNYPPLYFILLDLLSRAGDVIFVGRMVSLLAFIVIVACIGICIRRFGGSLTAAVLGCFWFAGTMLRYSGHYVGMNGPQLPALAIMMIALVVMLWRPGDDRAAITGMVLIVVGVFFKNSLIATPIAAQYLLACQNQRAALRGGIANFAVLVLGLALCTAIYGMNFAHQLLSYPRDMSAGHSLRQLDRLGSVLPALLIWAAWTWRDRSNLKTNLALRWTCVYVVLALIGYMVQKLANQIDVNAQFELNVALAIGLGLAFDAVGVSLFMSRLGTAPTKLLAILLLAVWLIRPDHPEPYLLVASANFRASLVADSEIARAEIARIAAIPGNVACSYQSICYRAGKPFVFDPTFVDQALATGRRSQADIDAAVAAAHIRFEEIDKRADGRTISLIAPSR